MEFLDSVSFSGSLGLQKYIDKIFYVNMVKYK